MFSIFCGVVFLSLALPYLLMPRWIPLASLEKRVIDQIESAIEGSLSYNQARISYFPFLKLTYEDVRLDIGDARVTASAKQVDLSLRIWKILFFYVYLSLLQIR